MKKILLLALVVLGTIAAVSCNKEDDKITNKMVLRGQTYTFVHAICANMQGFVHVDLDTKGGVLHGYGGFESSLIGKTTDLKGGFFLSFNPQEGPSIDPQIKSGTVTVKEVDKGLHIKVDAVEEGGEKFTMDVYTEDMGENF